MVNQQGDVVGLINGNKQLVVEYYYDAWGRLISTTGSLASSLGANNPLRYRGYIYDTETELYYLQSRYYNPSWGRFINADGQLPGVGGNVIGYNLFAYCLNNPVNMSDPLGNWPSWRTIFKVAATVITVTAVAVAIVATAGAAGVAAGVVSTAVVKSAVIGTMIGGGVTGTANAIVQGITKGEENINYKEVAASTFAGSVTGSISGGAGSLVPTAARGTTSLIAQKACQVVINTNIAVGSYLLTSPEPTAAGLATAAFNGFISGVTFNAPLGKSVAIATGLEFAGYAEEIIEIFMD